MRRGSTPWRRMPKILATCANLSSLQQIRASDAQQLFDGVGRGFHQPSDNVLGPHAAHLQCNSGRFNDQFGPNFGLG